MAVTIDKYSVQLSADAQALSSGLQSAGQDVEKFSQDADAKAEKSFSLKGVRKNFKAMSKDIAFVGLAADHLTEAFGGAESAVGKLVGIGKDVALGWAIGGPIGAGIGAVVALGNELGKVFKGDAEQLEKVNDIAKELQKRELLAGKSEKQKFLFEANDKILGFQPGEREARDSRLRAPTTNPLLRGFPGLEARPAARGSILDELGLSGESRAEKKIRTELAEKFDKAKLAEITEEFKRQTAALGMTEAELSRYKIGLLGLGDEAKAKALEASDAFFKAKDVAEVRAMTKSLQEQADAFGLNATQAKLFEKAREGAPKADILAAVKAGRALEEKQRAAEDAKGIRTLQAVSLNSAAGIEAQQREIRAQQEGTQTDGWDRVVKATEEYGEKMLGQLGTLMDISDKLGQLIRGTVSVDLRDQ